MKKSGRKNITGIEMKTAIAVGIILLSPILVYSNFSRGSGTLLPQVIPEK